MYFGAVFEYLITFNDLLGVQVKFVHGVCTLLPKAIEMSLIIHLFSSY